MDVLINFLPNDLVYIIEEYAKDRTNYNKVISQFESGVQELIECRLSDIREPIVLCDAFKNYYQNNSDYHSIIEIKSICRNCYERRFDVLNVIIKKGQLKPFNGEFPYDVEFPSSLIRFYSNPEKCIYWKQLDRYFWKKKFFKGIPKNKLFDQMILQLNHKFYYISRNREFWVYSIGNINPFVFCDYLLYKTWLKKVLSNWVDPYYYQLSYDDEFDYF